MPRFGWMFDTPNFWDLGARWSGKNSIANRSRRNRLRLGRSDIALKLSASCGIALARVCVNTPRAGVVDSHPNRGNQTESGSFEPIGFCHSRYDAWAKGVESPSNQ